MVAIIQQSTEWLKTHTDDAISQNLDNSPVSTLSGVNN